MHHARVRKPTTSYTNRVALGTICSQVETPETSAALFTFYVFISDILVDEVVALSVSGDDPRAAARLYELTADRRTRCTLRPLAPGGLFISTTQEIGKAVWDYATAILIIKACQS
ncbi:hypothetical protein EVAR_86055_1 [Eumeta japonica]|uniref:Uncharacterized protein n=1 Tax=Eumeta variegata TaxID=151549 RepID=A0A4C1UKQ6_EUMVA|nr:hypothetical protein EVAR_86055_1 [Eumeta japonica]